MFLPSLYVSVWRSNCTIVHHCNKFCNSYHKQSQAHITSLNKIPNNYKPSTAWCRLCFRMTWNLYSSTDLVALLAASNHACKISACTSKFTDDVFMIQVVTERLELHDR